MRVRGIEPYTQRRLDLKPRGIVVPSRVRGHEGGCRCMRCDPSIHVAYKAAREGSPRKRWLLGELYKYNFGLTKILLDQVLGHHTTAEGKHLKNRMAVPGGSLIDFDDEGMGYASIAFIKACNDFAAEKGSFSMFLKRKIYYEIQVAVMKAGSVTVRRLAKGEEPPGVHHFIDDEDMAKVLDEAREDEDEDAADSPAPLLTADPAPEPPPPPPPDTRSALEVLLAEHLVFGRHVRSPAIPVRETYASIAYRRVELADQRALTRELAARGVRRVTMRVPWWPRPLGGLAGVGLQSDSS